MAHLPALIADLALILAAGAVLSLIFRFIKQPVVLGYLVAGMLVGPHFPIFPDVADKESIQTWAEIGVFFLMFGLGLEFSFRKLLRIGGVAGITAIVEVSLTLFCGYLIGRLMGWGFMDSLFLGGILSIASTTIISKSFDEAGLKNKKFAQLVTGILVVEDLVAVLLMVLLSTLSVSQEFEGVEMLKSMMKLVFFLVLWFVLGIFFVPSLLKTSRRLLSDELLLILSLAFCFVMVVLASEAGFSPALGAFIMGSILAETTKAEKIDHLIQPLKSLFGALFFVSVGMMIDPELLVQYWIPISVCTLVLLMGKPFFVFTGALISGQPIRIAVQAGMSLSQIGEFSFIIAGLGLSLGVVNSAIYPIAVAVSVLTTFTTPYMIRTSDRVYNKIDRTLPDRLKHALTRYGAGTNRVSEENVWKRLLRAHLINLLITGVVCIASILGGWYYLKHFSENGLWDKVIVSGLTILFITPFLWSMAFRQVDKAAYLRIWAKPLERGPLIVLQVSRLVITMLCIGFLLDKHFSAVTAMVGLILVLGIMILFRKKIARFYGRIEKRFISNYNTRTPETISPPTVLAPWDSHLAEYTMHAGLPFLGKPLVDAKLRERFGINIATIKRGNLIINVPGRNDSLYPGDVVSVIGTDAQLSSFSEFIQSPEFIITEPEVFANVILHHFTILAHSPFLGKSIRDSGLKNMCNGMVVGVERHGSRILNPESELVLQLDDTVWVVGEEHKIKKVINETC